MEEWNMTPIEAHMAAKVCDRLWEEFDEFSEEVLNDGGEGTLRVLDDLHELKGRLMRVLPYEPREV
jgi:hypothetical protein